jgi:hypothetical protein
MNVLAYVFIGAIAVLLASGYAIGSASSNAIIPTADDSLFGAIVDSNATTTPVTNVGTFNSDGSLTGSPITNDPSTYPGAQPAYPLGAVWDIVTAVALAEGFNQGNGTAPYDLNNPGDLSPGDEQGQATAGPPQAHGGSNIIFFATVEGGFIALYQKFFNIVTGNSTVYPKTLTWTQVAQKYAGNSAAWVANVTNYLGVAPSSTPAQYAGLA